MDLIVIERDASEPLHRQLYHALRRAIEDRTLRAGTELPSARTLATDLSLARNTVTTAGSPASGSQPVSR